MSTKKITTADLFTFLTEDFVTGNRDSYKESKNASELAEIGESIIPKIGTYMQSIEKSLKKMESEEDREEIEFGWIEFLKFLTVKFEIDIEHQMRCTHKIFFYFSDWAEWAVNYRVSKPLDNEEDEAKIFSKKPVTDVTGFFISLIKFLSNLLMLNLHFVKLH